MLQSKSINKDVTNCYKVKITFFFEKRITIFTFFLKRIQLTKQQQKLGLSFSRRVTSRIKEGTFQHRVSRFIFFVFLIQILQEKRTLINVRYTYTYLLYIGSELRYSSTQGVFFLKSFFFFFGLPVVGIVLPLFRLQTRHYKTWDSHFAISNLENRPQKKLQVCLEVTYGTYVSLE